MIYQGEHYTFERLDMPTNVMVYDWNNTAYTYQFSVGDYVNGKRINADLGYSSLYCAYIYEINY